MGRYVWRGAKRYMDKTESIDEEYYVQLGDALYVWRRQPVNSYW